MRRKDEQLIATLEARIHGLERELKFLSFFVFYPDFESFLKEWERCEEVVRNHGSYSSINEQEWKRCGEVVRNRYISINERISMLKQYALGRGWALRWTDKEDK